MADNGPAGYSGLAASMCHENRQIRTGQNAARESAEDHFADAAMAVAAHHQHIRLGGSGQQNFDRRATIPLETFHDRVGVMPG